MNRRDVMKPGMTPEQRAAACLDSGQIFGLDRHDSAAQRSDLIRGRIVDAINAAVRETDYYGKYRDAMWESREQESALLWKALNRLLRECQWSRERNGYYVESRSGEDIGVAHMLREAEEAHTRYVHEHE